MLSIYSKKCSSAVNYARNERDWEIPNPVMGKRLREPEGRIRWLTKEEASKLVMLPKPIHELPTCPI